MRVTDCLREALGLPESSEHILPGSMIHPWNGWIEHTSGLQQFRTSLWLDLWEHMTKCSKCREQLQIKQWEADYEYNKLLKRWKECIKK